ncbi:MAG: hypothetical protein ACR2QC_04205 [Gammaproteobacteria bacterium]
MAIKDELDNDPLARGYAGMTTAQKVTSLNTVDRTIPRQNLQGWEIVDAIDPSERSFLSATGSDRVLYDDLVSADNLDISQSNIQTLLQEIFSGPQFPNTRTNMTALETAPASRAVELGLGVIVEADIEDAEAA